MVHTPSWVLLRLSPFMSPAAEARYCAGYYSITLESITQGPQPSRREAGGGCGQQQQEGLETHRRCCRLSPVWEHLVGWSPFPAASCSPREAARLRSADSAPGCC